MHELIRQAYGVLDDGAPLAPRLAKALGALSGEDVLDLASLAKMIFRAS